MSERESVKQVNRISSYIDTLHAELKNLDAKLKINIDSTKKELDSTKKELDSTKKELVSTKKELDVLFQELTELRKAVENVNNTKVPSEYRGELEQKGDGERRKRQRSSRKKSPKRR
jgi:hypothetical protein